MRSPLFVFLSRQSLQPLLEYEERFSFSFRLPSGETTERKERKRNEKTDDVCCRDVRGDAGCGG